MTPQEKKYLTYGGYAAGAGIAIWLLLRDPESGGGSVDPTGNTGVNPGGSNAPFNAKDKAEKLYRLMEFSFSDKNAIMAVFVGVTELQFGQIKSAFGKRSYNEQLGNQQNWSPFFDLPLMGLEKWLKSELSATQFETLQLKYPNHL